MFTPEFETYVRPARTHAALWRLALGITLIFAIYVVGIAAIFFAGYLIGGENQVAELIALVTIANTPIGMFLLFASFVGAVAGPAIVVRFIHKRAPITLFGMGRRVLRDFLGAMLVVMIANTAILLGISVWLVPVPNLAFLVWLPLLPLTLVGIFVQTLAEELVFRAYLQQQLAARFGSPLIWMGLPSLLFAMLHYDPGTAGTNTWLIVLATGIFGLIAADLTRITGNIGAAWGFHFANNLWAIALIAVDGNITGLALFVTPYSADDSSILPMLIGADIAVLTVLWLVLRRILRR